MCHGDIHGNAKCSCTKLNRHEFLQHSPECENYQATIRNIKPCKNRALIVNQLANNVSQREFHSHSIVAGGLPDTSYTTRFKPRTSLMMRFEHRPSSAYGKCAQCAVMKSVVCTARSATT